MLVHERSEKIKTILETEGKVTINHLVNLFQVTKVTIRKDLARLEKEGLIKKIHGGAILLDSDTKNDNLSKIQTDFKNYSAKQQIAEQSYSTINQGESIFIGSGQTCYLLAQLIKKEDHISVITNNIDALNALVKTCNNVVLIGGEVEIQNGLLFSLCNKTNTSFEGILVNKAFTSTYGIDLNAGLTVAKESSAYLFDQILKMTHNWTLMVDDSKFGKIALYKAASLDTPNCIITNSLPDDYRDFFENAKKPPLLCHTKKLPEK